MRETDEVPVCQGCGYRPITTLPVNYTLNDSVRCHINAHSIYANCCARCGLRRAYVSMAAMNQSGNDD